MLALLVVPALATSSASATTSDRAADKWQDGKHDEDQIISCITQAPATGVSANVSWRPVDGRIPKVGEVFYVRAYAGLVALPCSGSVIVVPEIIRPAGLEFDDETHPLRWALTKKGQPQRVSTEKLAFDHGVNGGYTIEKPGGGHWELRQGDVLVEGLEPGEHRLVTSYAGSTTASSSTSAVRVVFVTR